MKVRAIAFRNIFRNRRRSLLSGSAIMVATAGIVLLFSFLAGMKDDIASNQQTYGSGAVRIRHAEYTKNERLNPLHLTIAEPEALLEEIRREPGVGALSARIRFPSRIYREENSINVEALGLNFETEGAFQRLDGEVVVSGRLPEAGKREAVLGFELARKAGVGVGDKLTLLSSTAARGTNAMTFTVTGLLNLPMKGLNDIALYAPLDRVQHFLRMPGQVQEILIKTDGTVSPEGLAKNLALRLGVRTSGAEPAGAAAADGMAAAPAPRSTSTTPTAGEGKKAASASAGETDGVVTSAAPGRGLEILDWKQIPGSYSFIEMASTVYNFVALFFFALASTVILNTSIMVIFERMKEIGTMGAMGMTGREMVRLFFLESFFIALIASALGVALGMGGTMILNSVGISFGEAMEGVDFDMSTVVYPRLTLKSTLIVYLYSLTVSSLVILFPARKVSRIRPVEALRAV